MDKYNQLMLKFWGIVSIILPIVITYFVITDGFKKWGQYYVLSIFTILMYLVRKWMMKRMEKHLKFLDEEAKNK